MKQHFFADVGFPFWTLLCLYIIAEHGFSIRGRFRQGHPKKQNRDCGSIFVITLGMDFLFFLSFNLSFRKLGLLPAWMSYAGDVLRRTKKDAFSKWVLPSGRIHLEYNQRG